MPTPPPNLQQIEIDWLRDIVMERDETIAKLQAKCRQLAADVLKLAGDNSRLRARLERRNEQPD